MKVALCGVRGSSPASGPEFLAYGGHTSCLSVAGDDGVPRLLLDAGTGISRVTSMLGGSAFEGAILFGHLHWDHTQGLPFFMAGDRPDARVDLYMPAQGDALQVLERAMSPPHFPITPDQLRGRWSFSSLEPGHHSIEGFSVLARDIPHKGGRAFGYRVSDGAASVAYLSDHCPTSIGPGPDGRGELHPAALELASGCDVLFHDAQYTDEELPERAYFGHASAGYALDLAKAAGVSRLVLFHHDPRRTDTQVAAIAERYAAAGLAVEAAREGTVIDLAR